MDTIWDLGYAPEYVEGIWQMRSHSKLDDYVLATNTRYSVKEFAQMAFEAVNLDWEKYGKPDARSLRPTEVDALIGDCSKAKSAFCWEPRTFVSEMAKIMVRKELERAHQEAMY